MKPKRKVDAKLLATIRTLPCIGCNNPPPNQAAHVTSRGAGGDDVWNNVMSLCAPCHRSQHNLGWIRFSERHGGVKFWLEAAGRTDVLTKAIDRLDT